MILLTFLVIGLMIGISTGLYYTFYGEDSFFEGFIIKAKREIKKDNHRIYRNSLINKEIMHNF